MAQNGGSASSTLKSADEHNADRRAAKARQARNRNNGRSNTSTGGNIITEARQEKFAKAVADARTSARITSTVNSRAYDGAMLCLDALEQTTDVRGNRFRVAASNAEQSLRDQNLSKSQFDAAMRGIKVALNVVRDLLNSNSLAYTA